MEAITRLLEDPAWWFSLVVGSVLFAVIGRYFTDYVDRSISVVSKSWAAGQKRRQQRRKSIVLKLAASDARMAIALHWAILASLQLVMYLILILGYVMVYQLKETTGNTIFFDADQLKDARWLKYVGWALAGMTLIVTFHATGRIFLVLSAWAEWRKKNRIPPF